MEAFLVLRNCTVDRGLFCQTVQVFNDLLYVNLALKWVVFGFGGPNTFKHSIVLVVFCKGIWRWPNTISLWNRHNRKQSTNNQTELPKMGWSRFLWRSGVSQVKRGLVILKNWKTPYWFDRFTQGFHFIQTFLYIAKVSLLPENILCCLNCTSPVLNEKKSLIGILTLHTMPPDGQMM